MLWSWPGMPTWGYALMTAGTMLFWGLVLFGLIVVVHWLGREKRSTAEPPLPSGSPGRAVVIALPRR